jgi:hypothetical protein
LDLDSPSSGYHDAQQVEVRLGDAVVDRFSLPPNEHLLRKIQLAAAQLGTAEMSELQIRVDKTFVPALVAASNNKDTRELGVRVFHAFVDHR